MNPITAAIASVAIILMSWLIAGLTAKHQIREYDIDAEDLEDAAHDAASSDYWIANDRMAALAIDVAYTAWDYVRGQGDLVELSDAVTTWRQAADNVNRAARNLTQLHEED
jgi:hypothetical protein